ncbi:MarR family winged helix-turn-helix transcriptional regulator [Lutimonas sp.]|uniref:MarR family winged helix-turn-helix transcriptional regulator n=1 Tax=Lutimonas sp. TaxID=1872403 RepID=UPI003D9B932A
MNENQLLLSSQICFPVYSVSRLITKAYTPHLNKLGITYPQYLVMLVLWEQEGVSIGQIKNKLYLDTNTLSPLLKRMEKMGFIIRTRSKKDERSVMIELTKKGKDLKSVAASIPDQLFEEIVADKIEIDDMLDLKKTLCELITVLTDKDKKAKE